MLQCYHWCCTMVHTSQRHHSHLVHDGLLLLVELGCVRRRLLEGLFIYIACSLIVAVVCAERFAMCKWIVPVIVSAVLSSESLFVARPVKQFPWAYPLCINVIVPDVRRCW